MELNKIENLLIKYENVETTLEEEKLLKEYFNRDVVAPHLVEYKIIFNCFTISKKEKLSKLIVLSKRKKNRKIMVASFFLIFVAIFFIGSHQYKNYQKKKKVMKIYTDVNKGLKLLAINLKKGENAVKRLYTYENTAQKILK